MTDTDRSSRMERWKRCHALAQQRARMARKQGRGRLLAFLLFLLVLLTAFSRSMVDAGFPPKVAYPLPRTSGAPETDDWPVTDRERGLGGDVALPPPRSSRTGRYRSRPPLSRLMADLRRPFSREDATRALMARIPDPLTREWVGARIDREEFNRLSIWVRAGRSEVDSLGFWREEAAAALADEEAALATAALSREGLRDAARLLEAMAGTDTITDTPSPR